MKIKYKKTVEENAKYLYIAVPIDYGEEEMPLKFYGRVKGIWAAKIDLDEHRIISWPKEEGAQKVFLTVKGAGTYALVNIYNRTILEIREGYVPNKLIPGEWGDTIEMDIDANGVITNWPKYPSVEEFVPEED